MKNVVVVVAIVVALTARQEVNAVAGTVERKYVAYRQLTPRTKLRKKRKQKGFVWFTFA